MGHLVSRLNGLTYSVRRAVGGNVYVQSQKRPAAEGGLFLDAFLPRAEENAARGEKYIAAAKQDLDSLIGQREFLQSIC